MENDQLNQYIDLLRAALVLYPTKEQVMKRYIELKTDIENHHVDKEKQENERDVLNQAYEIVTSNFL